MIKAKINNIPIEVVEGTTIVEAAKDININIPVLCKHPDLPATAACGICVVKEKNYNKMLRACCTAVEEGMELETHTSEIIEVRRNVLELILSNHPNDCLNCGKNGACELQDMAADFAIRKSRFASVIKNKDRDFSTGSLVLDFEKCIRCGRCLEVCQHTQNVWALSFLERGINTRMAPAGDITLADSPCVRCGQCSAHCPTGAIYELDETKIVYDALHDNEKYCVVQIAPAVRVAIGEDFGLEPGKNLTGQLYTALRRLGFKAVFDTSFGADVTIMEEASEFLQRFAEGKGKLPLITTCCPSWVDFMEKKYPKMIENFSSCKSPMEINGVLSKTYYAEKLGIDPSKIFMAAIMPCTSKKAEIKRSKEMYSSGYPDVDVSLTTRELSRMLKQAGIDLVNLPKEKSDHILGKYSGAGVIFGTTGGVMEAAMRSAYHFVTGQELEYVELTSLRGLEGIKVAQLKMGGKTIKAAVAHGLGHVHELLDEMQEALKNNQPAPYDFIEIMACQGGCIGGGGLPYGVNDKVRRARLRGLYHDDEDQKRLRCSHLNPYVTELYKNYLDKPLSEKSHKLLHTSYHKRAEYLK